MRRYSIFVSILLCMLISENGYGQSSNFSDGFEDGDFTANPAWSGDTGDYTVIQGKPNAQLQLSGDSENGGTSYLSTSSSDVEGSWEFYIRLDFSPSGSNYANIFLMSDIANLGGPVNGYALQAGESGSDDVFRIVRFDNGSKAATVLSGTTDIHSGGDYRVKVSRQSGGDWSLEVAQHYDGILSPEGGTQHDNTYTTSSYFGVQSHYTSSRSDKFFFDFKIDLPPFSTTTAIVSANNTVDVAFNKAYDQASVDPSDFSLNNGLGTPASISFTARDTVQLIYNALPSDHYTLSVNSISDPSGNQIQPTDEETFTVFGAYAAGDVKINEFMYDPPAGQAEYIELKNTSSKFLNLSKWKVGDDTNFDVLQANFITLPPNKLLVLSTDTTALFNSYGSRLYRQPQNLPSLNNSGDAIRILTNDGTRVDSLIYQPVWGGSNKALERRSVSTSAVYAENWGDSPNKLGGTPGLANDIAEDTTPPQLTSLHILSDQLLEISFDERLDSVSAANLSGYGLSNSSISSVQMAAPDTVQLSLGGAMQNATHYTLTVSGPEDIFSNAITGTDTSFTYYKISPVDSGDVAINEFMYAPSRNTEYIELYNRSSKSLDLNNWTLSDNRHTATSITNKQFIVPPDSFVVLAPENTLSKDVPGIALISLGSSFPALNNSGDQIIIRNRNGMLLDSLQYRSDWGGKGVALERRTISISGTYPENWGDSPNPKGGTPGRPNEIPEDTSPPHLTYLNIENNQKLELGFNERLQETSLSQLTNYTITNSSVSTVQAIAPDTASLILESPLKNTEQYSLSISGIKDLFGNAINNADTSFTFYKVSPADSGDIAINEFMYVPPPNSTEYIELYNHSDKSLNLQGWTLSDNRDIRAEISDQQLIIPPDSLLILAPDDTILKDYPSVTLISMGSHFPALNNGDDQIVIRNAEGTLMDSLQYSSDWGGDEVALERRTVSTSGTFNENWGNAPNGFGTPGMVNESSTDKTSPSFTALYPINASTLQLIFSERITAVTATDESHYAMNPNPGIRLIYAHNDSVTLYLKQPMTSGRTYSVTTSGLADIFGNILSESTRDFKFVKIDKARPHDIILNEIMYDPSSDEADFVELYNPTDNNFNLKNWFIGDATGKSQIDKDITLQSDSYLVLTGNHSFAEHYENAISLPDFPALNNNSGDAVYIQRKDETTIDSLFYSQSWGDSKEGISIEREDPLAASNDSSNWKSNSFSSAFSAGQRNSHFQPDTDPPNVIFSKTLVNKNIEVRFNEFIKPTQNLEFSSGAQPLSIATFDSTRANIIFLTKGPAKDTRNHSTITARNLTDVKGNTRDKAEIPVAQPLRPANLVINEIMYNPLQNADDNRPDQNEYIELQNTKDYALSLEGIALHDAPDEDGSLRKLEPLVTTAKWVPARGRVLIYADSATTFPKSNVANFFDMKAPKMRSVLHVDRSSLSLASSGDAIYLADSTGATIDSVYYDKSWQNPNLIDTRGIALERINPKGPSSDESNWGSSVNPKGGTPNEENSIYQSDTKLTSDTDISFTPNPFSPDNDGYEDNLLINYKLEQQDYLIRLRIYDRYGRLVRKLVDGKPAGFEGQLIWDGRKNDGSRNRIGIYIIVFEAFDSTTGNDKSFKKTVVLARKLN